MIYYEVEAIMNKREMIVFMKSYVVIAMIIIILIFEIIIVNIVKRLIEASRKSNIIIADIKSFYKMSGRPTRYKFDIEFELNDNKEKGRITIIDGRAEELVHKDNIPIIYSRKSGRMYWANESKVNRIFLIIFMTIAEIFLLVILLLTIK